VKERDRELTVPLGEIPDEEALREAVADLEALERPHRTRKPRVPLFVATRVFSGMCGGVRGTEGVLALVGREVLRTHPIDFERVRKAQGGLGKGNRGRGLSPSPLPGGHPDSAPRREGVEEAERLIGPAHLADF